MREDINGLKARTVEAPVVTSNIEFSDLVGHWGLSLMKAEREVGLNKDGAFNSNHLLETTCL